MDAPTRNDVGLTEGTELSMKRSGTNLVAFHVHSSSTKQPTGHYREVSVAPRFTLHASRFTLHESQDGPIGTRHFHHNEPLLFMLSADERGTAPPRI